MGSPPFSWHIGRAPGADWRVEEDGVWDHHLQLEFQPADGIVIYAHPSAPVRVNGYDVQSAVLRSGDILEFGSLKAQFWLSQTEQVSLRPRELLTWTTLGAISLAQVALIYYLLR